MATEVDVAALRLDLASVLETDFGFHPDEAARAAGVQVDALRAMGRLDAQRAEAERAERHRMVALHRQALAERDQEIERLVAALERAERVEAALLELATEISRSLQVDQPPGRNQLGAWLALATLKARDG